MSATQSKWFVNTPKLAGLIPLLARDLLLRPVRAPVTIVTIMHLRSQSVRASSPRPQPRRASCSMLLAMWFTTAFLLVPGQPGLAQRVAVATRAEHAIQANDAVDSGAVAGSQPLSLTLRLAQSPQQTAALDALLSAQADSASPSYHRWLTPAAYASQFGATDADLATLTAWLTARGLAVTSVSAGRTRLTISGQTASVESAFAVPLRRMTTAGALYFANAVPPTIPVNLAAMVAGISGLDDLPSAAAARIKLASGTEISSLSATGHAIASSTLASANVVRTSLAATAADPLTQLATVVDADTTAVISLTSTACLTDLSTAEIAEYRALLRQANAQGITVLATSSCVTDTAEDRQASAETPAFPAALSEVTAITVVPAAIAAPAVTAAEARPACGRASPRAGSDHDLCRRACPDRHDTEPAAWSAGRQHECDALRAGEDTRAIYPI